MDQVQQIGGVKKTVKVAKPSTSWTTEAALVDYTDKYGHSQVASFWTAAQYRYPPDFRAKYAAGEHALPVSDLGAPFESYDHHEKINHEPILTLPYGPGDGQTQVLLYTTGESNVLTAFCDTSMPPSQNYSDLKAAYFQAEYGSLPFID